MPPKTPLRRAVLYQRHNICKTCHNLDPRDHASSVYLTERREKAIASLSLVVDAFELSRTRPTKEGGCRFCNVLCQALDAFFRAWRGSRQRVNVEVKEKEMLEVGLDQEAWKGEAVGIYIAKCTCAFAVRVLHEFTPIIRLVITFLHATDAIQTHAAGLP